MPLFISQNQNVRGIRWRGIAGTVVVELLVLVAVGAAVVRYVEWSSDAALAEFMSATEPSASVASHSGERSSRSMSVFVKVCGCRPYEGGAARTGAGVRKPSQPNRSILHRSRRFGRAAPLSLNC